MHANDLAGLNHQPHCGSFLAVYRHLGKSGDANDVNPIQRQITSGNSNGLDSLIYGTRPDGLHLSAPMLADYTCDGPGN